MKHFFLFALVVFLTSPCVLLAQTKAPEIEWAKCFGGKTEEYANSIAHTFDGGYIVAGSTYSFDGDVSGKHGINNRDVWVVKLNSIGSIEWQKCLGGSGDEEANSIIQTIDGGFAIAGSTTTPSTDGDVSRNHGNNDIWVVKLDTSGTIQWERCLGSSGYEEGYCIIQSSKGGYVVAGYTQSSGGDVSGNHGYYDAWIISLTSLGYIQWEHSYGGTKYEEARTINETPNGGYIFAGHTTSEDGDVSGKSGGFYGDVWIVKIDLKGNLEWQKCVGDEGHEEAHSITSATDGGYAITGFGSSANAYHDAWVVKLSTSGSLEWQKPLGGMGNDEAFSIIQTQDGGYAIAGFTGSKDVDVTGYHGNYDAWVVKLTSSGNIQWQKCMGGSSRDGASSIIQTTDGSYVVAGYASSIDGDVLGNRVSQNVWVIKLKPTGSAVEPSTVTTTLSLTTYPNPATKKLTLGYDLPKAAADVVISISDVTGRRIEEHHADSQPAGHNEMTLDLGGYAAGTYYITVSVGDLSETTSVEMVR